MSLKETLMMTIQLIHHSLLLHIIKQKLPDKTLKRLGLEQVKARYLPLHLHACELTLPEEDEEKKIHLVCRPPHFFSLSLKRLRLEFPEVEKQ